MQATQMYSLGILLFFVFKFKSTLHYCCSPIYLFRSLGLLATDYNRKWQSLFNDWEMDVFGGASALMSHTQLWTKFAVFQSNAERRATIHMEDLSFSADDWASTIPDKQTKVPSDNVSADRISISSHFSQKSSRSKMHELLEASYESDSTMQHLENNQEQLMYDSNLRTEAPPLLTEMFHDKRDIAEKILHEQVLHRNINTSGSTVRNNSSSQSVFVPSFGQSTFGKIELDNLKAYLVESFRSDVHPFGVLNTRISFCFYTSYGCWKVKPNPILSAQAMREWEAISRKIYTWVRRMFPALPIDGGDIDGYYKNNINLFEN